MHVQVRRVYEARRPDDGTRVLVDRLWPRGLTKDKADLDQWCKLVAPSTQLRRWYDHDPDRFEEFTRRYQAELEEPEQANALTHLAALANTVAQARQVRALRTAEESIADLVRSFGVSRATIYRALQPVESAELVSAEGGAAGG